MSTHLKLLESELAYLDGYAICDWNSDKEFGYALDARREKLNTMIAEERAKVFTPEYLRVHNELRHDYEKEN